MAWPGASSAVPSSTVQLSFEATGLRNRDVMGTSDPMLVAFGIDPEGKEIELGRSEATPNTLNPKWVYHLTIQYRFEEVQPLHFIVLDIDSNYKEKSSDQFKLEKQEVLGEIRTTLAEILVAPWQKITLPLQAGVHNAKDLIGPSGTLTIRAETVQTGSGRAEEAEILVRCSYLENMELFSKNDPFLAISMPPVCQTETVQSDWVRSMSEFGRVAAMEVVEIEGPKWRKLLAKMVASAAKADELKEVAQQKEVHAAEQAEEQARRRVEKVEVARLKAARTAEAAAEKAAKAAERVREAVARREEQRMRVAVARREEQRMRAAAARREERMRAARAAGTAQGRQDCGGSASANVDGAAQDFHFDVGAVDLRPSSSSPNPQPLLQYSTLSNPNLLCLFPSPSPSTQE